MTLNFSKNNVTVFYVGYNILLTFNLCIKYPQNCKISKNHPRSEFNASIVE